jgi:hypothetical protein
LSTILEEITVKARFFASPLVWDPKEGQAVAVFLDRDKAESVSRAAPNPPEEGWKVFPMNELELLAWLREKREDGISRLLLDPEINPDNPSTMGGYQLDLAELLDSGKTLSLFQGLADAFEAGGAES